MLDVTKYILFSALRICGVDCLLTSEWKSPNKIIARTGQSKGAGDIIVVTKSGGVGTSTVKFRGYNIQIGVHCCCGEVSSLFVV